jgi:diaminopimelate decarboxylase
MGEGVLTERRSLLRGIAEAVGTPVYVYDAPEIRRRYGALVAAFEGIPHRICYSVKANSNLAVLALLRGLGAGADIVSGGELARAAAAGFRPGDIVFSGVGKRPDELEAALRVGVGLINVESPGELERLHDAARRLGVVARMGIRVNPEVTAETHPYTRTAGKGIKFGVPLDEVLPLARCAAGLPHARLCSLGMHIGSQIAEAVHFRTAAETLAQLVRELRAAEGPMLESVDVGGGLAIRYTSEPELSAAEFAAAVRPLWDETGLPLVLEPGRFLVGSAGVLLTRCLYRKHTGGRDLLIVDAGMNDLLRPSLYGAAHDIRVIVEGADGPRVPDGVSVDVVGPVCETGDFLGLERRLPGAGPGALLAVLATGAYGFSMSSTYNSRPRPAEVLVDDHRWAVVRARESVDDLLRGESLASRWVEAQG